ncbi:unnamed protein product [Didymodactylos carnosus]|uniref:Uncharacterized protein n=1 Tax=Didymodactylos carnosus TaxID=1234261 RepID=A0A815RHU1_9BILA|nr:unnamed protein product [Didymodactylos carnosus]CAF4342929.1 unnamed protein product [Didymodactylos carnosus]
MSFAVTKVKCHLVPRYGYYGLLAAGGLRYARLSSWWWWLAFFTSCIIIHAVVECNRYGYYGLLAAGGLRYAAGYYRYADRLAAGGLGGYGYDRLAARAGVDRPV